MMKQWMDLKAQAQGALLFFRLGDFYELFEEDAVTAAPVLGVVLTARNNRGANAGSSSPLCGVPVSNLEVYLNKALEAGFKVALAEQVEEPQAGKSLVKREIVQWFTPGIRLLQSQDERPHYSAFISGNANDWIAAIADVATGHFLCERGSGIESLQELIDRLPIEDLRSSNLSDFPEIRVKFKEEHPLLNTWEAEENLVRGFQVVRLEDLQSLSKKEILSAGTLLAILTKAHPGYRLRFQPPREAEDHLWISAATRKNLNLFEPEGRSLFDFLNQSQSAAGRRELRLVLSAPTQNPQILKKRQEIVQFFKSDPWLRQVFRSQVKGILDLQRLLRRKNSSLQLLQILSSLENGLATALVLPPACAIPEVQSFLTTTKELQPLVDELKRCLQMSETPDEDCGWIRSGINPELDELRNWQQNSHRALSELEEDFRNRFKIPNLKIRFHQVFGYLGEVSNSHKEKIPADIKILQNLANATRFKTPELEKLEEKLLSLKSRIREAECSELERLHSMVETFETTLLEWAEILGRLDAFQSLAEISVRQGWITPETLSGTEQRFSISEGVHPLSGVAFVPQTYELKQSMNQLMLLTGPNMAGKSTLLRLTALFALLHQVGSDVPAQSAQLSLFDRIACRMGAQDELLSGQSTFFVEMREVASMLSGATSRSLLLFDEIGRGTSTFDGMSLAWAITEAVHEIEALALVATHYLELAELESSLSRLRAFHFGVKEVAGKLIFTRRLERGPASRSYGIEVARLAEVPSPILQRAQQKLKDFEKKRAQAIPLFELMGQRIQ